MLAYYTGLFSAEAIRAEGIDDILGGGLVDTLWWSLKHVLDPGALSENYGAPLGVIVFAWYRFMKQKRSRIQAEVFNLLNTELYIDTNHQTNKKFLGPLVYLDIIEEVVSKYDLKIEIGGGVRTLDSIKKYVDAGVDKVILGSAAIKNKEFLKEACEKFKNKIALGLDAKNGNLSVSGWKENLNIKTIDFLKEVNSFGVSRIIYTDINKDGMKTSPNFDDTIKIAELSNCPVVISGGVSSINDIKKAKDLNNKKIEGIIIGKAIYDGDIKLDELAKEINA